MAATRPQNPSAPAPTPIVDAPQVDPAKIPPLILGEVEMKSEVGQPAALEELGGQLLSLLECLTRFHEDLAHGVSDLSDAVVDGSRAALKSKVNVLGEILEWTGAVSEELGVEAQRALAGESRTDTGDLLRILGREIEEEQPGVRVTVSGNPLQRCWGRPQALKELFRLGLHLARLRMGGAGASTVEIGEEGGIIHHRILGLGEPARLEEPEAMARFSNMVREVGATVRPDSLGPYGTGMIVGIPAAGTQ